MQKLKELLLPIRKGEWTPVILMFFITCLININYTILRSARNAVVVVDKAGSANLIPWFELFGTLPAAILMTWGLTKLLKRYSIASVFYTTSFAFLAFFAVYCFAIHPVHFFESTPYLQHIPSLLFFVVSELWKVILLSVLFWGFLNRHLLLDEAKRFYPPLMLGGSIGAVLAGPITTFCTSKNVWNAFPLSQDHWQHVLVVMTICLCTVGLAFLYLFSKLLKHFKDRVPTATEKEQKEGLSLGSAWGYFRKSPTLWYLGATVWAEYIAYCLGELFFLDKLKAFYPAPADYFNYMGQLNLWCGVLTALGSVIIAPLTLQRSRWVVAALVTPLCALVTGFGFFGTLCFDFSFGDFSSLELLVFFGSLHYCLCRSAKYAFSDPSKELAFMDLPAEAQVKGKLIVDGIGSRFGRGASSLLSISLITISGSLARSSWPAGILALFFTCVWVRASQKVGENISFKEKKQQHLVEV